MPLLAPVTMATRPASGGARPRRDGEHLGGDRPTPEAARAAPAGEVTPGPTRGVRALETTPKRGEAPYAHGSRRGEDVASARECGVREPRRRASFGVHETNENSDDASGSVAAQVAHSRAGAIGRDAARANVQAPTSLRAASANVAARTSDALAASAGISSSASLKSQYVGADPLAPGASS